MSKIEEGERYKSKDKSWNYQLRPKSLKYVCSFIIWKDSIILEFYVRTKLATNAQAIKMLRIKVLALMILTYFS